MHHGSFLAELKVPADAEFIPAAKRLGASLGAQLGFSLEEIDELCIAVEVEGVAPTSKALARRHAVHKDEQVRLLADQMIRMFVDDFRSNVDAPRGRVHLRLVKYLIG